MSTPTKEDRQAAWDFTFRSAIKEEQAWIETGTVVAVIPTLAISLAQLLADTRAREREANAAWLRLQAAGLAGTGRWAEISTLTFCADAIEAPL